MSTTDLFQSRLPLAVERLSEAELTNLAQSQAGSLYELDGEVFYSPNCNRRVQRPKEWSKKEPDNIFDKDTMRLGRYQKPMWYHCHYRFLPYVPLHTHFHDWISAPLYVPLSQEDNFVKNKDGFWTLPESTIERWDELLRHVNWLIGWLFAYKPPHQRLVRDPAELGYRKSYKTWKAASVQAQRSRDWFVMVFASATWLLAEYGVLTDVDREDKEVWKWLLARGVDKAFLYAFINSTIVNISPSLPRAGCFMNVVGYSTDPDQTARQLTRFLVNAIPVWIPWNSQTKSLFTHSSLLKFQPSAGLVQSFDLTRTRIAKPLSKPAVPARMPNFSSSVQQTLSSSSTTQQASSSSSSNYHQPASLHPSAPSAAATATAPALKPWQLHLQKRADARERYLAKETEAQRQSREDREKYALKSYSRKSEVYIWDESASGVRERKRVNKKEVDDVMSNYGVHQKRYDSVNDEWDLCSEFGDWTEQDQEAWDDEEQYLDPFVAFNPLSDEEEPPAEVPPPQSEKPPLYTLPEIAVDDSPLSPPPDEELFFGWEHPAELPGTMPKRIRRLFGLEFHEIEKTCPPLDNFAVKVLYRAFGGYKQPEVLEDRPINRLLSAIFQRLQHPNEFHRLNQLSAFDLAPLCPGLKHTISALVTVVNGVYVISPATVRNPAPRIVVYTPEAAVFACRLDDDYDTIVLALYHNGIRFNACYEAEEPPVASNTHLLAVLPAMYRKGTKSNRRMYEDYVQVRKYFLVGHRRRAALLGGGLISRIAAEVIASERECERLVLQDPCSTAHFSSTNVIVRLPNGNWLYDDVLLPSEKDCLLGVHFIGSSCKLSSL
jgi:hypothetical protein